MWKKFLKPLAVILLLVLIALFLYNSNPKAQLYYVKRAIDGDTILLSNNERVRYIGINTPETKHPKKAVEYFGEEAFLFNKELVSNKWVRLEFDIEKRDKYNRLLAYVYAGDIFVNARLVEEGYAQVYTFPPNIKHSKLFLTLQADARRDKRGLWNKQ